MAATTTTVPLEDLSAALQALVGRPLGPPGVARDPVNQPMIRHWCDAMGDDNPVYTDPEAAEASVHRGIVAPPTMLQAWNMAGLRRRVADGGAQAELMRLLDEAGYTSVVATNCEQVYHRYLRPGDLLTEEASLEAVSELKRTALGEGYFVDTVRRYLDDAGEVVGEMRFRILKFKPARPGGAAAPEAPAAPETPAVEWPHPAVNRDTAFFWEGTRQHELRIQRCGGCGLLRHPPLPSCPACGSSDWEVVVASGAGTVYSYVVHHHPPVPPLTTPFVVVLVELAEGTRVIGNLLEADPSSVQVGMPVEVTFVTIDDELVLPQWRPARGGSDG
ncbi:MAG TPA: OB-fold domain-containing protein [Acidimicrobiales bacterium]|nr:OB-fold domain-containing protein [Acidimicrobiales bacterium]